MMHDSCEYQYDPRLAISFADCYRNRGSFSFCSGWQQVVADLRSGRGRQPLQGRQVSQPDMEVGSQS